MLTRKQRWRMQRKCLSRPQTDYLYETDEEGGECLRKTTSEPALSSPLIKISRLWSTTNDLSQHRKSVRFQKASHLKLIPTRDEYVVAGLAHHLWWVQEDYQAFKQSAVFELKCLMSVDSRIDARTAQTILYQPKETSSAIIKAKLLSSQAVQGCHQYDVYDGEDESKHDAQGNSLLGNTLVLRRIQSTDQLNKAEVQQALHSEEDGAPEIHPMVYMCR